MMCKYNIDGICTNADCHKAAYFCIIDTENAGCDFFENCENLFCSFYENAKELNMTDEEKQKFSNKYFTQYKGVKNGIQ